MLKGDAERLLLKRTTRCLRNWTGAGKQREKSCCVFFRMVAQGRGGPKKPTQITSITKAWKTACRLAECPGTIPHDFRRAAVRNLDRAGISRSAAMRMVGHKTESIYRRYRIVDDQDLRDAAARLNAVSLGRQLADSYISPDGASKFEYQPVERANFVAIVNVPADAIPGTRQNQNLARGRVTSPRRLATVRCSAQARGARQVAAFFKK